MKKAVLFLATGFEETEAVATADVLRRGEIDTRLVSITGDCKVTGAHGISLLADALFSEVDFSPIDALILPGGMPGAANLNACEPLKQLLVAHHGKGKLVAAICAAPLVPGGLGLLKGCRATCYPGFEGYLAGATLTNEGAVVHDRMITGKGPALVFDFALKIVSCLQTQARAESVAGDLLLIG
ncbi:MAG: DJ-1/PfpI family protein [Tannerellaceae bacterium]|jgi:4-methyl-5(b-hydroxyethyl)-thiazole monophosphate biosynthesis|nr:DJ-1/PfpI family protein [Tannerellaceae bacterium]